MIIEQTMSTTITNKQQKRNCTQTTDIHFKTSTWKLLVNQWRALSTHVKTRRTEAKISLASFTDHLRRLPCDGQVSQYRRPEHSLWLNKRYIWNSKMKIVKRSTQQRYRRLHWRNTSLSSVVQLSRPCWIDRITCFTAAWLAQLGERRSTEREVAGSNPGRTNTQGL